MSTGRGAWATRCIISLARGESLKTVTSVIDQPATHAEHATPFATWGPRPSPDCKGLACVPITAHLLYRDMGLCRTAHVALGRRFSSAPALAPVRKRGSNGRRRAWDGMGWDATPAAEDPLATFSACQTSSHHSPLCLPVLVHKEARISRPNVRSKSSQITSKPHKQSSHPPKHLQTTLLRLSRPLLVTQLLPCQTRPSPTSFASSRVHENTHTNSLHRF